MFSWGNESGQERERGLVATLLLAVVVVGLIGTAVVFSLPQRSPAPRARPDRGLSQREAAWTAEMHAALRNAATEMEAWATETGRYLGNRRAEKGFDTAGQVDVLLVSADVRNYCLRATHENLPPSEAVYFSSVDGGPTTTPCI